MSIAVRPHLWSPFGSEFDTLVRRAFAPVAVPIRSYVPAADIHTEDRDIVIKLELPGVDADSKVAVELDGRHLVVAGHRGADRSTERNGFMVREIRSGSFRRTFTLPVGVTAEQISAGYEAGVLTVHVRDAVTPAPQAVSVPVSGLPAAHQDAPAVDAGESSEGTREQA